MTKILTGETNNFFIDSLLAMPEKIIADKPSVIEPNFDTFYKYYKLYNSEISERNRIIISEENFEVKEIAENDQVFIV